MSGMSDSVRCPNCGGDCDRYTDYKPYDYVGLECYDCGFYTDTTVNQATLEELNEWRKDRDMKPLKTLPKWNM